jgi:hypothetical protein
VTIVGTPATPPAGDNYATASQLRELVGTITDEAADALIADACDWIDAELGARTIDPITGRKVIEAEVEPWQWTKLVRATLKVAARLHADSSLLTAIQFDTVKGPDFETSGRITANADHFGRDVSALLDQSGLRVLTAVYGSGRDRPPWYSFAYNVEDE